MLTVTGASSQAPSAAGAVGGWLDPDATVPTEVITPGVVSVLGSVTVTASPAFTSDSMSVFRLIVTRCRSEVADRMGPDAGPPRLPVTWLTRSASGLKTTEPSDSEPDGLDTPSDSSNSCTAYWVSHE